MKKGISIAGQFLRDWVTVLLFFKLNLLKSPFTEDKALMANFILGIFDLKVSWSFEGFWKWIQVDLEKACDIGISDQTIHIAPMWPSLFKF